MKEQIKKPKKSEVGGLFAKGNCGGPGRPAGRLNKVNADIKAMIVEALSEVGGVDYLAEEIGKYDEKQFQAEMRRSAQRHARTSQRTDAP